jgi:TP901 family phage tail tape measure protein
MTNKTPVTIELNAYDGFSHVILKVENNLTNLSTKFDNIGQSANKNLNNAANDAKKLNDNLNSIGKNNFNGMFKGLYNGFNEISYPLNNLSNKFESTFKSGINLADNYNTNLKRIESIAHLSSNAMDNLKKNAELTSRSLGESISSFSSTMYTATKNAVTTQQGIIDASKYATMMSKDLEIDKHMAMESIVNFTHSYGLSEENFKKAADLIVWTKEKSGSEVPDIQKAISYGAPVASSFKIPQTDFMSMVTQMSLGGIKGSSAGTAIRNLLYGAMDPKALLTMAKKDKSFSQKMVTDGVTEIFDRSKIDKWHSATKMLGIKSSQMYDEKGVLRLFDYLIPKIQAAQSKLPSNYFSMAIKDMFGKNGVAGITQLISKPADHHGMTIQKSREVMGHYDNQGAIQFKFYQDSVRGKSDKLQAQIDNLKTKIVNSGLIDFVSNAIDKITIYVQKLNSVSPWILKTFLYVGGGILVFAKLGAAIVSSVQTVWAFGKAFMFVRTGISALKFTRITNGLKILRGALSFASVISKLSGAFRILSGAITVLRVVSMGFLMSNPWTALITVVVGALVYLGYLIYDNWDKIKVFINIFKIFFKEQFDFIVRIVDFAYEKIIWIWGKIKSLFGTAGDLIGSAFPEMGAIIKATSILLNHEDPKQDVHDSFNLIPKDQRPFYELPVPQPQNQLQQKETKSIVELTIKDAPKGSKVVTKSSGDNPPLVKMSGMGFQDLAYE